MTQSGKAFGSGVRGGRAGATRKVKYPQCARAYKRRKNILVTTNFNNELLFLN